MFLLIDIIQLKVDEMGLPEELLNMKKLVLIDESCLMGTLNENNKLEEV